MISSWLLSNVVYQNAILGDNKLRLDFRDPEISKFVDELDASILSSISIVEIYHGDENWDKLKYFFEHKFPAEVSKPI